MTDTSNGLIITIKKTYENIDSTFTWDLKQSSVQSALLGSSKVKAYTNTDLTEYIKKVEYSNALSNPYPRSQVEKYLPKIISGGELINPKNKIKAYTFHYIYQFIKYLTIFSFILGSLFIFLNKKRFLDKEFSFMIFI